jgi:hypothetical protein
MKFAPKLTAEITKVIPIEGSDASITIKYIKPGVMQNIIQSTMNLVSKQADDTDKMRSEVSFNLTAKNRAIVQECMKGWTGFLNESDKPLKFNALNLTKMMDESDDFVAFVVAEHDKLAEEVESKLEEAEKN